MAVLDKELVSRFDLLSDPDPGVVKPPLYVTLDVLSAHDRDFRPLPLQDRREALESLVENGRPFADRGPSTSRGWTTAADCVPTDTSVCMDLIAAKGTLIEFKTSLRRVPVAELPDHVQLTAYS